MTHCKVCDKDVPGNMRQEPYRHRGCSYRRTPIAAPAKGDAVVRAITLGDICALRDKDYYDGASQMYAYLAAHWPSGVRLPSLAWLETRRPSTGGVKQVLRALSEHAPKGKGTR